MNTVYSQPELDTPATVTAGKTAFAGLTVRDVLAAHAMQGLLAAHSGEIELPDAKTAAKWAREYADAVLTELADHPFA